jgi:hypothetical protein
MPCSHSLQYYLQCANVEPLGRRTSCEALAGLAEGPDDVRLSWRRGRRAPVSVQASPLFFSPSCPPSGSCTRFSLSTRPISAADITNILREGLTLALVGGTPGGLVYWGIERRYSLKRLSGKMEARIAAVRDLGRPLAHRSRGSLRRIAPTVLVALILMTAIIFVFPRWWAPQVSWWSLGASSAGLPRVDLLREFPIINPTGIALSPDGARLAAYRNVMELVIWNDEGQILREAKHPYFNPLSHPIFAAGGAQVVVAGGRVFGARYDDRRSHPCRTCAGGRTSRERSCPVTRRIRAGGSLSEQATGYPLRDAQLVATP